ncbi:MAG: endolytic transglycosylase MltG [Candidatus Nanopelagicales bacterium]
MSSLDELLSAEPLPPSRHRSGIGRILGLVVAVLVIFGIGWGALTFIRSASGSDDYAGPGTGSVTIVVRKGDSLTAMGATLAKADVVKSADAFVSAASANEDSTTIGPGTYTLRRQMSGDGAVALMLDPVSRASSRLVLPEGLRLTQTLEIASDAAHVPLSDFEAVLQDPGQLRLPGWANDRPEGFMFPATYDLAGDESAKSLLRSFVKRFEQASADSELVARAAQVGRTPYEILIIASLLQGEGTPNDFAKIARVVYNRLDAGMPLQFDSTTAYGLGVTRLNLSQEQLDSKTPYNTYVVKGLPPTPINSPGDAAIEAALNPARGKWLYFVTVNPDTKETKFAKSYDRFLELKREFQSYLGSKGSQP